MIDAILTNTVDIVHARSRAPAWSAYLAARRAVTIDGPRVAWYRDTLGRARQLPPTEEGDVLLIGVAGAYGRAMSSYYNLRAPAREVWLDRGSRRRKR